MKKSGNMETTAAEPAPTTQEAPLPPQAAPPQQAQQGLQKGIIKSILSGDAVIIRGQPRGGPPPERQLCLSNIVAPRIARRATANAPETKDEPYAWEAREFLRKKCIGKEVCFTVEYKVPATGREYGVLYLGTSPSGENLTESLISAGLVDVRRAGLKLTEESQRNLVALEEAAQAAHRGKWASTEPPTRNVQWVIEHPRKLVDRLKQKPQTAVIEHVRDGCTVRAFLLPNFEYVTVMLSGVKAPMVKQDGTVEPYAQEAKFFVESRLLQREIKIILEGVSNNNVLGTVLHPNGNITEMLLKEGFARCVDWSMGVVTQGTDKYRQAEKAAKEANIRIWKGWKPSEVNMGSMSEKEFNAKVVEVVNADGLIVKTDKGLTKIFLSSVRPPRPAPQPTPGEPQENGAPSGARRHIRERSRPLFDVPYLFEAREFLRQKLVGKKVSVKVDYVQPPANNFPEKVCCSVYISGANVADALITKGLATVIRYRQDDDQRSQHYDQLLASESRAIKKLVGLHSKDEPPRHMIQDMTTSDSAKSKSMLPFLSRQPQIEGLVEFVASGSRVRILLAKETCLLNFLLNGVSAPRGERPAPGPGGQMLAAEPGGEEATAWLKERCLQRDVTVKIESTDRAGNFIGWLFVDGVNMSVAIVEKGLAKTSFSAENSSYAKQLETAEAKAKEQKLGVWKNYVEADGTAGEVEDTQTERERKLEKIIVTDVAQSDLTFYAQKYENGPKFEKFMEDLRIALVSNPSSAGVYKPQRNELCVAKFEDDQWYRARVQNVDKKGVKVLFIDFGNTYNCGRERTAKIPSSFAGFPAQAKQYRLACVRLPKDEDMRQDAIDELFHLINNQTLTMNVEYRDGDMDCVSLYIDEASTEDVAVSMLETGFIQVENRREVRLAALLNQYKDAQEIARKKRANLWRYGDVTEDEAREFGAGP